MRTEEEIREEIERAKKLITTAIAKKRLLSLYIETLEWVLNDKGER
jgi:hypothetical protein